MNNQQCQNHGTIYNHHRLYSCNSHLRFHHRMYIYHLPLPTRENVYVRYPLEDEAGGGLLAAHRRYHEILERPRKRLPEDVQSEIKANIPGVLPQALNS